MAVIETDYLIVGAGAAGMAFADALIADAGVDIVMVEQRHCPGGHWNDAYPFVRIHQASANYGVNSRMLGTDTIDQTGPNAGFYERATAMEICDYFQRVLDEVLLPSGRVRFFGMCDYVGNWTNEHAFNSRLTGTHTTVRVRRKIVDTTYLQMSVPATHTPTFAVDPAIRFFPVGELVSLTAPPTGYTILGAGKTAMDACIWLLDHGVDPASIRWIRPRDVWVHDRAATQPLELVALPVEGFSLGIEALAQAESVEDLWRRVEACGQLHRLDPRVTPTSYRGAVLSTAERKKLKTIDRVVRLGHVRRLGADRVVLDNGEISTEPGHAYVDCTAYGFRVAPARPIFEPARITIQSLMASLTTFNAALIGYIEATRCDDEREQNRLCPPTPTSNLPIDWLHVVGGALRASTLHSAEPDIEAWMSRSRLNLTRAMVDHRDEPRIQAALSRLEKNAEQALQKAEVFLGRPSS